MSGPRVVAPSRRRIEAWDWVAVALLVLLLSLVAATFGDYGVSNDEEVQHVYGEKLLAFYRSGFADRSAFAYKDLYFYGGLFDLVAVLVGKLLPFAVFETRHLLCALVGVLGVAGVWRLGRLLISPRAGFLAAALLAVTGDWYGGMFNHTKDIPFAVAMLWGLHFLCRLVMEAPRPRLATALAFGTAVGFSLGLRVGGLLFGLYGLVATLAWAALRRKDRPLGAVVRESGELVVRALPGLALAYDLMAVFWPWSVLQPLNPLRAFDHFAIVQFPFDTILAGKMMRVYEVPRSYVPIYLAIKLPLVLLLGLALAVGFAVARSRTLARSPASVSPRSLGLGLVAFAACFPIVYAVLTKAPAHDGIRHFLFVVPPLAVLAGAGWNWALDLLERNGVFPARAFGAGLSLMILWQTVMLVRLYPYQNVDYNALVGGLPGAQRRYVMDYWANTVPEATRALADHVRREFGARPIDRVFAVFVCSEPWTFKAVAPPFLVWIDEVDNADFFIAPTHMNCDDPPDWPRHLLEGKIIHEVKRLGVVLAVVRDLRNGA